MGSSFQTQEEIMRTGYSILPKVFTLSAYNLVLDKPLILLNAYKMNIMTTILTTIIGLWIISTYSYVLSRRDYKYRRILAFYVFFTMLFNGGLVPSYILISKWLALKDTPWVLIIPLLCSSWNILMMKGFFSTIPDSLIEAAKLDGAGELYTFIKIIIPISKPAFATIGLFYVLTSWNDWYLSMLYIESDSLIKLQYMLMKLLKNIEFLNSAEALQYGLVKEGVDAPTLSARMAMCILAAGPMLVVFPFFQKYFVKGLTVGSVKG
jgi:putative aldouronate transport system permease protein